MSAGHKAMQAQSALETDQVQLNVNCWTESGGLKGKSSWLKGKLRVPMGRIRE